MRDIRLFLMLCLLSASIPLLPVESKKRIYPDFPGWPLELEGRRLEQLPLSDREQGFVKDFPGRVGRFSDGEREIIIRWVTERTRKLHPAADCYRGIGYRIVAQPIILDSENIRWNHFTASHDNSSFAVLERIYDLSGNSWTDVSSWYWASLLSNNSGPWWAITVARHETAG